MARFLLDTYVLIDFSKGRQPAKSRILEMINTGDDIGICPITIAEFFAGLLKERRDEWKDFFSTLLYWDIFFESATQAGSFQFDFLNKGKTLLISDTLIAATALQEEATLVTRNAKDYPMKELSILQLNEEKP